jgi:hypothetical protein
MPALARPLYDGLRTHASALLSGTEDPHDELLALVWGPRFDREHALGLMARQAQMPPQVLHGVLALADRYDALAVSAQWRLRRLILRHRSTRRETMAHHAPHPAD